MYSTSWRLFAAVTAVEIETLKYHVRILSICGFASLCTTAVQTYCNVHHLRSVWSVIAEHSVHLEDVHVI